MNTSCLAHISISIFGCCRSLLFSIDAASYFLVGRHRLSSFFLYARDTEFRKNIKKKREGERLPISFLMSVFVSYLRIVNTYTVFSLVSRCISSERTKKLTDGECVCVCVHTHTKKTQKKEGYTPESRMAALVWD